MRFQSCLLWVIAVFLSGCVSGAPDEPQHSSLIEHGRVEFALSPADCNSQKVTGCANGVCNLDLTVITIDGKWVELNTANALCPLRQAALADGVEIIVDSGWRSEAEQKALIEKYPNLAGQLNKSAHQSGKAIDISTGCHPNGSNYCEFVKKSPEYIWMKTHANAFGFFQTLKGEGASGKDEPWHWVYQGPLPVSEGCCSCVPKCEGNVMVGKDCSTGDCGVFGAACVMESGAPACAASGCSPICKNGVAFDKYCAKTDCAAQSKQCMKKDDDVTCVPCVPHCENDVMVGEDCSKGDCGAFGTTCKMDWSGPTCVESKAKPSCEGAVMIAADGSKGDCSVFGLTCFMLNGNPKCTAAECIKSGKAESKYICVNNTRFWCDGDATVYQDPCPGDQGCNACALCGPVPKELCDGQDNDCDGQVDEGVKNACGSCGAPPLEICDGKDNDCDGQVDEFVSNACGTCGPLPEEVCDGQDNDCDGQVDEGVKNACGSCGAPPLEVCDGQDNDCDGVTDNGFAVGAECSVKTADCVVQGVYACSGDGKSLECVADPCPNGDDTGAAAGGDDTGGADTGATTGGDDTGAAAGGDDTGGADTGATTGGDDTGAAAGGD
ncbi:MAG TPA: hypothetical protein EYN66_17275, partial [Myxococcales bacterium]|nr:hypothetical protein [Myxococcales bacterium]